VNGTNAYDLSLLVIRAGLGVVFIAHGYNHIFGGGKIAGTGRWFESLGMRPGILHAWLASLTEVGAGVLLLLGLATPLACAGVVGTMVVALVTNHLKNGFFIFRPGEGYEYVLTLVLMAVGLAGTGAGGWSVDHGLDWFQPAGWWGLALAVIGGGGGAIGLLVVFWRPAVKLAETPA
jgi:putative oxidoreductase